MQLRRRLSNTLIAVPWASPAPSSFQRPRPAEPSATPCSARCSRQSSNRLDQALDHVEALLRAKPNFRLAYLIKGDLLLARGRALTTFGNAPRAERAARRLARRGACATARLSRATIAGPGAALSDADAPRDQRYAIVVRQQRSRRCTCIRTKTAATLRRGLLHQHRQTRRGEDARGDERTPVGVYHVTASLPRAKLSDFYGSAPPISYPNEWDRAHGRNGHGIWLHGTPSDTYSRAPRASNGCVFWPTPTWTHWPKTLQIDAVDHQRADRMAVAG